ELVALAAHGFDQNGEVKLATPADDKAIGRSAVFHAQRDVAARLLIQPLAQPPRGAPTGFALAPGERRRVHAEGHTDGRLLDADRGKRLVDAGVRDRVADADLVQPGERDDIPGGRLGDVLPREVVIGEQVIDL